MKFVTIVGARPQFMKAAVLSRELRRNHEEVLVHTGQHYDDLMSDIFFRELAMPAPDVNLGIGSGSHATQTARALEGLEAVFVDERPDVVIVFGDTNSTLAGALAAAKLGLPIAHVEAGLRSYERDLPEEINRVLTDHVSTYLFAPTGTAVECLRKEGIVSGVHHVGDVMYDSLLAGLPAAEKLEGPLLASLGVEAGGYYLATTHRPSNTDDPRALGALLDAFSRLESPVVLPLHPRTREAIDSFSLSPAANIRLIEPVGYFESLALQRNAKAVLTDSGGVQREAYFLAVPCVTLRTETEWPETLAGGWNVLAGNNVTHIVEAARRPRPDSLPLPAFGDGHAAGKIVEILGA